MVGDIIHPYTVHRNYIKYSDYAPDCLKSEDLERKQIPGTTSPSDYFNQLPLQYKYDTIDDFIIEACEMESKMGILSQFDGKQTKYYIHTQLDLNNPNHARFLDTMKKIYRDCVDHIDRVKHETKLRYFKKETPEETGFKHPIHYPRDYCTGDLIPWLNPSFFLKLISEGIDQTLFTDLSRQLISWHKLLQVEMKFIPLIHIKYIHIGQGSWSAISSIQIKLISAVVTSFYPRNSVTKQITTLSALKQFRPELLRSVTDELITLSHARKIANYNPMQDTIPLHKEIKLTFDLQDLDHYSYVHNSNYVVTYHDYKSRMLKCSYPEYRTVPGTGPCANPPSRPESYWKIPLMYNYEIDEPNYQDFLFEGCEMETKLGIESHTYESGKIEYYISAHFNPEYTQFIDSVKQIYNDCSNIVYLNRGCVKMHSFNKDKPETGLNPIFSYPSDIIRPEKDASTCMFLKLFKRGYHLSEERTLFTNISGNLISWDLLIDTQIKFIPLLHIKHIFVKDGKASIQMEMQSAIITSITPSSI